MVLLLPFPCNMQQWGLEHIRDWQGISFSCSNIVYAAAFDDTDCGSFERHIIGIVRPSVRMSHMTKRQKV